MPQLDFLIFIPIIFGFCPIIFFHYFFLLEIKIPNFFGVIKFRNKLLTLKKHIITQLH